MLNKSFDRRRFRLRTKLKKFKKNRLCIFKSNRHIYAQIVDDIKGITLVSASTLDKMIRVLNKSNCNINNAVKVGSLLADKIVKHNIGSIIFDRSGYKYHGIVSVIADEVRKKIYF